MRISTFKGGVHPKAKKELSADKPLQVFKAQGDLIFPLSQHIGKPAVPVVKKNDPVLAGQLIAKADGFVSANIISSCSGKVKAIEPRMTSSGTLSPCIVIENDGLFTPCETIGVKADYTTLSGKEIIQKVQDAGIVGLGGAGFPTHVKLSPKDPSAIDYVIANGAECEPYITCDDMLMQTHPDWIVEGLKIVLKLFPNAKGVIAIEDNKPKAIASMQGACKGLENITVQPVKTKYPQGGEKQLINVIAKRQVTARQLPADVGCIVDNVATLSAIYHAVALGEPLMEKWFTVTGEGVANPGNYVVKIGTSIAEVLDDAGGLKQQPKKILLGGPMMGIAVTDIQIPVIKTANALVCLLDDPAEKAKAMMTPCIRCGRCAAVCPLGLIPQMMQDACQRGDLERFEKVHGMDCITCGTCSYICPAKRPLTEQFKIAKQQITAKRRREAAKNG